jgi:hypothetical protein
MVMQKLNQYAHPSAKAAAGSTNLPDHWTKAEGRGYLYRQNLFL